MQLFLNEFICRTLSDCRITGRYLPFDVMEIRSLHFGNDFPPHHSIVVNYVSQLPALPAQSMPSSSSSSNLYIFIEDVPLPISCPALSGAPLIVIEPPVDPVALLSNIGAVFAVHEGNYLGKLPGDKRLAYLLDQVISGIITDRDVIFDQLRQIPITWPSHLLLLVISAEDQTQFSPQNTKLLRLFDGIWPFVYPFFRDSHLVLLVGSDDDVLEPSCLTALRQILSKCKFWAGQSDTFSAINHFLRNHFFRALVACDSIPITPTVGRGILQRYQQITLFYSVHRLIFDGSFGMDPLALVPPKLLELFEYDRKNNTEYLSTLAIYWLYNRSTQDICQHLYIHKNTLFYRLHKIQEFLGSDFNNATQQMDFHHGIAILESLGYIQRMS